jgi:hypothetical protein
VIPGKDSDTRIEPLALTNGHDRYIMTVTPERTLASVGGTSVKYIAVKFLAVSLLKPPSGSRSGLKKSVGTSRKLYL